MRFRPRAQWTHARVTGDLRLRRPRGRDRARPTLAPSSLQFLSTYLRPTDTFVEFGSGRCTLWLAERIGRLASFEDLPGWYETVRDQLDETGANNVDYRLVTPDTLLQRADESLGAFPGGAPDGVLIAGLEADCCAVWGLLHVRAGGIIVVDQPGAYLAQHRAGGNPGGNGRTPGDLGRQFAEGVARWRYVRWKEGSADTAVFFKPAG